MARSTRTTNRKKLTEFIQKANKTKLKVGWNSNAEYENGVKVALIAAQNEFGNPALGIPARPFFRPAISENKREWLRQSAAGLKMSLEGKMALKDVFEAIGLLVAGDIRDKISEVESPPLAEATVKARLRGKKETKGSRKPLVATGTMIGSITSEIVE